MAITENEEHIEIDRLDQDIYRLISQAFIHLDVCDQQLMRRFGLTTTQSWALVHLADPEGRSLSELAKLLMCDKSNVTGIVDKLESAGWAVRRRGKAGDRRYTRVVLTEQGRLLRQAVINAREHMVRERLRHLGEQERCQLHDALLNFTRLLYRQFETDEETAIVERVYAAHQLPELE
ncbi:MAG: MarR family transcriptional regulator [Ktedonobacteraceae bacterium]|nr:MarR family transcriptional regulator [Ktedonobacteraceae bacterium]